MNEPIPLARPDLGEREEELAARGRALRHALAGPDAARIRATTSPSWLGGGDAVGGLERHRRRCTSASGRWAGARATRSSPRRSASSPRPTACSTRARRRSSATSTRSPSTSIPRRPAAAVARARRRASCPSTSSATRPTCRPSRRSPPTRGSGCSRTPAQALGAVDADGHGRSAPRGNLAVFAFYPNKQMTTGEGGMLVTPDPDVAERIDERAQPGPRPGHVG